LLSFLAIFPSMDRNSHVSTGLTLTQKSTPSSDLLAFAKEATAALLKSAQDLAGQTGIKAYCSLLVSELWAAENRLFQLEDVTGADTKKIFRLLFCLEQLSSASSCFLIVPHNFSCWTRSTRYNFPSISLTGSTVNLATLSALPSARCHNRNLPATTLPQTRCAYIKP
jgi:hypothetical protein